MQTTKEKTTRLNSEKKIPHNIFTIKIGSTNRINPEIIYVNGRTFITPKQDQDSFSHEIYEIRHKFQNNIRNYLQTSNLFTDKYILDFQVANNGIKVGKKSFLYFEFLIKQKNKNLKMLKEITNAISDNIISLTNSLEENLENYGFLATKKRK